MNEFTYHMIFFAQNSSFPQKFEKKKKKKKAGQLAIIVKRNGIVVDRYRREREREKEMERERRKYEVNDMAQKVCHF